MSERVGVCLWCDQRIVQDGRGNWVHASRAYTCRDRWGVLMSSSAEQAEGRWVGVYRSVAGQ